MFIDDPFDRRASTLALTDRAQRVLIQATEEARHLGHGYVGTEHVLLAIMAEPDEGAVALFRALSIDPEQIRACVKASIRTSIPSTGLDRLPYTARTNKVLTLAGWEAEDLAHAVVDPEHLLLGLAREQAGVAAEVLRHAGLRLQALREAVRRMRC